MWAKIGPFALASIAIVGTITVLSMEVRNRINHIYDKNNRVVDQLKGVVDQLKAQISADQTRLGEMQQAINNISRQRDELFVSAYQREEVNLRPDDVYESLDHGNFSPSDAEDRVQVNCKSAIHHKNAAVLLTLGQSNAANTVNSRLEVSPNILNFNFFDGNCYIAQEPLIGPTNNGGNFVTRLASKLVDRGAYQMVIVAPIAVGGTKVQDWAVGGFLNRRLVVAIKRLHDARLQPTHVLWHQGEANIEDDPQEYRKYFLSVFSTIRRNGVYAPIYVAEATICGGKDYESLRAAQHDLVDVAKGIFAGPNTDKIGFDKRYDKCHFSAEGADKHAEMWYQIFEQN